MLAGLIKLTIETRKKIQIEADNFNGLNNLCFRNLFFFVYLQL